VVILGNGGVLPAILSGFTSSTHKIHILCRQPRYDSALRERYPILHWLPWEPTALRELLRESDEKTLLIQATSAPLHGDALQGFAEVMGELNGYFVDLVYGKPSQLYHFALQNKIPCQDGLPMLIEQARVSQECWFGRSLGYEVLWNLLASVA
jgi:shikimate 5-dehydrogenase